MSINVWLVVTFREEGEGKEERKETCGMVWTCVSSIQAPPEWEKMIGRYNDYFAGLVQLAQLGLGDLNFALSDGLLL